MDNAVPLLATMATLVAVLQQRRRSDVSARSPSIYDYSRVKDTSTPYTAEIFESSTKQPSQREKQHS